MYWSVEIEEMDERWTNTQHALAITALHQARNAVADGTTRSVWLNQFSDNGDFIRAVCVKEDMDTHAYTWELETYNSLKWYENPVELLDAALIKMQNGNSIHIWQMDKDTNDRIIAAIGMSWEV